MPAPSQPRQYILLPVNPWFIGFTPDYIAGVWVGNDDNTPSRSTSHLAAELWGRIVRSSVAAP
jgi:membrane peptidoglycan carboxypeptidase